MLPSGAGGAGAAGETQSCLAFGVPTRPVGAGAVGAAGDPESCPALGVPMCPVGAGEPARAPVPGRRGMRPTCAPRRRWCLGARSRVRDIHKQGPGPHSAAHRLVSHSAQDHRPTPPSRLQLQHRDLVCQPPLPGGRVVPLPWGQLGLVPREAWQERPEGAGLGKARGKTWHTAGVLPAPLSPSGPPGALPKSTPTHLLCPPAQAAVHPAGPWSCVCPCPTAPSPRAGKERAGWLKHGAPFGIPNNPPTDSSPWGN